MRHGEGNLFHYVGEVDVIGITTNGFIKRDGSCVMGRGCAGLMRTKHPGSDMSLGREIQKHGNKVLGFWTVSKARLDNSYGNRRDTTFVSFPVKPKSFVFDGSNAVRHMAHKFRVGQTCPGWAAKADLKIIERSAHELVKLVDSMHKVELVVLPRPGCGAGELKWEDVGPVLDGILDDRFLSVTFPLSSWSRAKK